MVMSRESWFLETMTSQRIGQLAVLGELAARSIIWRFSFSDFSQYLIIQFLKLLTHIFVA